MQNTWRKYSMLNTWVYFFKKKENLCCPWGHKMWIRFIPEMFYSFFRMTTQIVSTSPGEKMIELENNPRLVPTNSFDTPNSVLWRKWKRGKLIISMYVISPFTLLLPKGSKVAKHMQPHQVLEDRIIIYSSVPNLFSIDRGILHANWVPRGWICRGLQNHTVVCKSLEIKTLDGLSHLDGISKGEAPQVVRHCGTGKSKFCSKSR